MTLSGWGSAQGLGGPRFFGGLYFEDQRPSFASSIVVPRKWRS
jgi:hypothetical protein